MADEKKEEIEAVHSPIKMASQSISEASGDVDAVGGESGKSNEAIPKVN